MIINFINDDSRAIGNDQFLKIPPSHEKKTIFNPFIMKGMLFVELREEIIRTSNRTSDQLGEKTDVQGKNTQMPFRLTMPSVDIKGIA